MGVLLTLAAGSAKVAAQASERGAALNWVRLAGADDCAGPVEMASRIEARLGRRLFVRTPDAIVIVEGQVSAAPDGSRLALIRVSDPNGDVVGERRLNLPAERPCAELDALAELVIAITLRGQGGGIPLPARVAAELDALFGDEPSELDPASLPTTPARAATPAAREAETQAAVDLDEAPATTARSTEFGVGAALFGASGLQPRGTFGPEASLRLSFPKLMTLFATFGYGLPQSVAAAGNSDGSVRYQALVGGLSACLAGYPVLSGQLYLCAQAGFGLLVATGEGFDRGNTTSRQPLAQLALEGRARVPMIGPLGLYLSVRVPVRLARPNVAVITGPEGSGPSFQVDRVGLEGAFGLDVGF